jgi:hypothetical protein
VINTGRGVVFTPGVRWLGAIQPWSNMAAQSGIARFEPVNVPASDPHVRVGCAGWSILSRHGGHFDAGASHLARYATRFDVVEINSSFYRPHAVETYARWAAAVPARFRFSVKMPNAPRRCDVDRIDRGNGHLCRSEWVGNASGALEIGCNHCRSRSQLLSQACRLNRLVVGADH